MAISGPPGAGVGRAKVHEPSSPQEIDRVVERLQDGGRRFVGLAIGERIALVRGMRAGYAKVAKASVREACAAKGIALGTVLEGQEWALGPWAVIRHLRLIEDSLQAIDRRGTTAIGPVTRTVDGRLAVRVYPASRLDAVLAGGVRVDVHMERHVGGEMLKASRGSFYGRRSREGQVVLVLGAGNVNAIVSQDVLTKMFNEGKVCLVKMNPVNAYIGPFLEDAFADAIRRGYLAIVYGGAEEGEYLVQHPGIDEIHITGSDKTFDAIVWGPAGPDRERRRAEARPIMLKPITAELGNVSPVLVMPGTYSDRELAFQAEDVASALTYNASYDCNAAKVVVTPAGWAKREAFVRGIELALAQASPRMAYYPGAAEQWSALTNGRDTVRRFGTAAQGVLPWTLCPGLDPDARGEVAFQAESFCPILFETAVGSSDPEQFLERAVQFANERLWGSLNATIIVPRSAARDPKLAAAVERAITALRYGSVGINAWPGLLYAFATPPWGAHPTSSLANIQSGVGWVHNTMMLEGIEKSVLRCALISRPKPVYAISHRSADTLVRRLTGLEQDRRWIRLPGVVGAALGG